MIEVQETIRISRPGSSLGEVIAAAGPADMGFTLYKQSQPHNQYGVAGDNLYSPQ